MKQVIFGGSVATLDDTLTVYNSLIGGTGWYADEPWTYKLVSTDGVIKDLRVKLAGAPGAGKKYTFTLMLNGAPTALTFDIADGATTGSDMVHEIVVTGGDKVSLRCVPDNTPVEVIAAWTSVFRGNTEKESLIMGGSWWPLNPAAIIYAQVMCGFTLYDGDENAHRQVVPTAGTIKNLYVEIGVDPGTFPEAYKFTLRKGPPAGPQADTTLTVTITADETTGSDLVNSFPVVAGDILTLSIEPLNTPSVSPRAAWGMTFVADIDGESVIMGGTLFDLDDTATEYYFLTFAETEAWEANETLRRGMGQVCILKKLHILLNGSPGAGNTYTFTTRIAGADSNVVAIVADAAITGNSAALEDTVALDDYVDLQVVPNDTPTVRDAYWGLVSYSSWAGEISGVTNPARIMGVSRADIASVKGVA